MISKPFRLLHNAPFGANTFAPVVRAVVRRPELLIFGALVILCNAPLLVGACWHSLIFRPDAVHHGEWWRLFTHPFVHVTWYHLLLDGIAFFTLYNSLV